MMLNSFYSTVTLRQPAGHCHHTVISYFGWRLAGTYPVCVCVRLAWPRATSPSARVHESPQSRCCSSPGAQKHPQTLTRCNLHRGDKTTWTATLQPGGYVFYIYIYIIIIYFTGCIRWFGLIKVSNLRASNLSDVFTLRAFVPERLELLCVNSPHCVLHDLQVSPEPMWSL